MRMRARIKVALFMTALLILVKYAPALSEEYKTAVIILFGGSSASIFAGSIFRKAINKFHLHALILEFLDDFIVVVGVLFSFIAFLQSVGVQVTGITIGASTIIGLILSFGLKDLMTNISAGAWVSVIEPFEIGDKVKVAGFSGTVKEMNATNVVLEDDEGNIITIPAKNVWNTSIVKLKGSREHS